MARVSVLGRSGTGKSFYAGWLLEQAVPNFDLAIHFDPEDEERGLSDADHDPLYQTLYVTPDVARRVEWTKLVYNHRKIRVVPEDMTQDEQTELLAVLCHVVMRLCKDLAPSLSALVSVDEAHNFLSQSRFPDACERLVTGGRKHQVEFIAISQRPQLLHTTVISQSDRRVYFALQDDNDIGKVDRTASFSASKLKGLPERTCIIENKDSGEWTEQDTNGIGRVRPHYSKDDGIVDDALPV